MPRNKYDYWLTPDGLALLAGWARDGFSERKISGLIGIDPSTLAAWKKKFEQIADALAPSRDSTDYEVENALRNNALAGNTTAQIFWLKNRRPDKWQDKPVERKSPANGEADPLTCSIKEVLKNAVL